MAEASLRGSAVDVELNPKVFDLTTSAGFVILDAISFRSTHVGPEFELQSHRLNFAGHIRKSNLIVEIF